jgi:hypothetical protein
VPRRAVGWRGQGCRGRRGRAWAYPPGQQGACVGMAPGYPPCLKLRLRSPLPSPTFPAPRADPAAASERRR